MDQLTLLAGDQTFVANEGLEGWEITHQPPAKQKYGPKAHVVAEHVTRDGLADAVEAHLDAACPMRPWEYYRKGKGKIHRLYLSFDTDGKPFADQYRHQWTGCSRPLAGMEKLTGEIDLTNLCGHCG